MTDAAATAAYGSSYCSSSAETVLDSLLTTAVDADVQTPGTTAVAVETAVDANFGQNGLGGIFGCPSCHGENATLIEALKLFLPYFPLHIQRLVSMYLKMMEFMHTFEMMQNMMNHMDEYQTLFKMFEGMQPDHAANDHTPNALGNMASLFGGGMPDLQSLQKMMEGSDLIDEFTYMEGSSGTCRDGS